MDSQADVLIVTVTKVESQSVIRIFEEATKQKASPITIAERVYHDLGMVKGIRVFMALSEMGASGLGASQQAVQKGIAALRPNAVVMVGIAFGISEKKQDLGDILVSRQLMLYDLQRVGASEIIPRGDRPHASARLINHLQSANLTWDKARVHFGVLLTGEKLVDNIDYRMQLQKLESEAIGGEMEGGGLYVACHDAKVDWILVKAICDWADGNKSENKVNRQRLAAEHAAEFVFHALQYAPLTQASRIHSREDNVSLYRPAPLPAYQSSTPTRESVRRLLEVILRTDSDLDAFCLDRFPDVKKKFANGNDRTQKINLLLEMEDLPQIVINLNESRPLEFTRYNHVLHYADDVVNKAANSDMGIADNIKCAMGGRKQIHKHENLELNPPNSIKEAKRGTSKRLKIFLFLFMITIGTISILTVLNRRLNNNILTRSQMNLRSKSIENLSQIDWIYVSGGTFLMGASASEVNNSPIHEVTLSPFYASRTEITVAQYQECFRIGKCTLPSDEKGCNWSLPDHSEHPVNCITWYDANNFAQWKNARLPTEAEWEIIASLGGTSRFPWGNEPPKHLKSTGPESGHDNATQGTSTVCSRSLDLDSSRGFCDLIGNVWEWCQDWYGPYSRQKQMNPMGPSQGISRIIRGGSWVQSNNDVDARTRNWRNPNSASPTTGFRIVRSN